MNFFSYTDGRILENEESRLLPHPPPTAPADGPNNPKIAMNVCWEVLLGLAEAIFEFPPQARDIGQKVVM